MASGSPRRREIMDLIGLSCKVLPSDADESIEACPPHELVMALSKRKAASVKASTPGCCVIGADTIVYLDGQIIGKPKDEADAARILRLLSGRTHTVYTGVCIMTDTAETVFFDTTLVHFRALSEGEIRAYIASGEPMDKAGAYGIQGIGAVLVDKIDGCYFNVIGMPVPKLYAALASMGIYPVWQNTK